MTPNRFMYCLAIAAVVIGSAGMAIVLPALSLKVLMLGVSVGFTAYFTYLLHLAEKNEKS